MPKRRFAWHTPDDFEYVEGDNLCRPLYVPLPFLHYVGGALSELTNAWQWEQVGTMTPARAAEIMTEMLENWSNGECQDMNCLCHIRWNPNLQVFETSTDGETWTPVEEVPFTEEPYAPEPIDLGGATDDIDRCLAAHNAAAALDAFYRETYGAVAAGLNNALVSINLFLRQVNQFLFGLIYPQASGYAAAAGFFNFDFATYMTAPSLDAGDLEALQCLLYCNATVEDGVVRFDYQAIFDNMIAELGVNPGTALTLLLSYWTDVGLDAAGSVGAITEAECDCPDCDNVWCYEFDFAAGNEGFTAFPDARFPSGVRGSYSAGKWRSHNMTGCVPGQPNSTELLIRKAITGPVTITKVVAVYTETAGTFTSATNNQTRIDGDGWTTGTVLATHTANASGVRTLTWEGTEVIDTWLTVGLLAALLVCGAPGVYGSAVLDSLRVEGTGVNPFGEENC